MSTKVKQKLMGIALLAISAAIIYMAFKGNSMVDRDITAIIITAPMGLYLLFTKEIVISD